MNAVIAKPVFMPQRVYITLLTMVQELASLSNSCAGDGRFTKEEVARLINYAP
ncbi:hypothetical protein N9383_02405 [Granulosicoccus sp.]|nr:hypothetical protein [Granulosicoccus sp.]